MILGQNMARSNVIRRCTASRFFQISSALYAEDAEISAESSISSQETSMA
jgi:hypothetical protein